MDPLSVVKDLGGGLISSGINFFGNQELQRQQNEANKALWREQRDWNTPQHQITMLRDAGLNPALALGKGVSASLQGSPPQMGRAEMPNVASDIAAVQQVDNMTQQNRLLSEQARKAEAEADQARHNADLWERSPIPSDSNLWGSIITGGFAVIDKVKNWFQSHIPPVDSGKTAYQNRDRGTPVNANQGIR